MLLISQDNEMDLFLSYGCGFAGNACTRGHCCSVEIPFVPPDLAVLGQTSQVPGDTHCRHMQFVFFESMTQEKSISCCFLNINKHNYMNMAYNVNIILHIGHAAVSKKLKHFEYKAVFSYTIHYLLPNTTRAAAPFL